MTLADFIAVWQAQPFRAFRLHTARGVLTINYPLVAALSPDMSVWIISGNEQVEEIALDEIARVEIYGEPVSLADAINAISPEVLARNAQLMANAQKRREQRDGPTVVESRFDPGTVSFLSARSKNGVHVVQASVSTRDGHPIFNTAIGRWNLHGVEQFENGTSLYLHHLDDPTTEQRVIIWPPDRGTLESFAEAKSLQALRDDLSERDARLTARLTKPEKPPPSYYREILPDYPAVIPDGQSEAYGEDPDDRDMDRFEIHLVPRKLGDGASVNNPCLVDVPSEKFCFDLTETAWDATFKRGTDTIALTLSYAGKKLKKLKLTIDPYRRCACMKGVEGELPLAFIERELRNYELYESWPLLIDALRTGPDRFKQPDVVLPLTQGLTAEMWAGETRFPLPFLQPRLLNSDGQPLLDLRATTWAAYVTGEKTGSVVSLRLLSHERKNRHVDPRWELLIDCVTQRVVCRGYEGATTVGMIQSMLRRVRGVEWLHKELPQWLEKGRPLPAP